MELFIDILKDTTIDTVKLIPFLFLTYLAMEYLENKAGQKTVRMLLGAGKKGPVIGGILGVVPHRLSARLPALFRSADFRQQQQICIPAESSQLER